jgi:hypothetical protein
MKVNDIVEKIANDAPHIDAVVAIGTRGKIVEINGSYAIVDTDTGFIIEVNLASYTKI